MRPWEALGMSRATWFRLGKPTTKPNRITQEQGAKLQNVSARSIQRARRIMREAPELALLIQAGKIKLGFAEKLLRLAQKNRTTNDGRAAA